MGRAIKRTVARKSKITIPVKQTDDGLHLADSILWFDSKQSGELSFLSSATNTFQTRVPQVIATEETVRILETYKKRPNALICQYNRPFSIGRLKMELLPSGSVLGGASLHVETERGRLLYAPRLQAQRVDIVRQMQLKKAHSLILGAHHPDPNAHMPNRKREKEKLLDMVHHSLKRGQPPILVCEPVSTAQEITKMLTNAGLSVATHDTIFRVNHVYETFGSSLGSFSRITKRTRDKESGKVMIFPFSGRKASRLRTKLPDGPVYYIEDSTEQTAPPSMLRHVTQRFYIGSSCDGPELKEVVSAVAPKELYIFGPYAKTYVSHFADTFKGANPKICPLFADNQPTLF